jgi:4-carboxymuconolactone decarboxylase
MDQALRDKGIANRKAVLGEDYVNKAMASADDFNRPFQDILNEYCWGMIWSDERLPRKTRSMLNLVMLDGGVPMAVECFRTARKVFAEVEKGA